MDQIISRIHKSNYKSSNVTLLDPNVFGESLLFSWFESIYLCKIMGRSFKVTRYFAKSIIIKNKKFEKLDYNNSKENMFIICNLPFSKPSVYL